VRGSGSTRCRWSSSHAVDALLSVLVLAIVVLLPLPLLLVLLDKDECPCAKWRWVKPSTQIIYVPDDKGGGSFQPVRVPGRWDCVERYMRLPEGGCGVEAKGGYSTVTDDAPKGSK